MVINPPGMARLIRSIGIGKAPMHEYYNLLLGRAIEVVPGTDIAKYILTLGRLPEGEGAAVQTLHMQFFDDRQSIRPHEPEIVAAGRELLRNMEFVGWLSRDDYKLSEVARVCLAGPEGYAVARTVCEKIRQAAVDLKLYRSDLSQTTRTAFAIQPRGALDGFLIGNQKLVAAGMRAIKFAESQSGPIEVVSEELLSWCEENPLARFPLAVSVVPVFEQSADKPPIWNPLAVVLVHRAPDPVAVMKQLIGQLRPRVWSGSRSTILDVNANLLDQFDTRGNTALAALLASAKDELGEEARAQLKWETELDRDRDERFE